MIRSTALPCPRCKASPHRREAETYPVTAFYRSGYRCHECDGFYPDWTESEAQEVILIALRKHPLVGWVGINNASDDRGRRATRLNQPDLHGYLTDGRALFVEVKAHSSHHLNKDKSDRMERQEEWLAKARACGCVAFVAWGPWDVEEQLAALPLPGTPRVHA